MNKKEFEEDYCRRSNIQIEEYLNGMITLPCRCGSESCKGWAAVTNNPLAIKSHVNLYQ
ncbi:hypothetical protein MKX70_24005 [Paenibacillus sp. FSL R7-0312]|uniref:hypothetical protein n=1 Tax=Paenibacillus sp. FSL R7-0312 TaxID=2921682 RepID=UPI0030F7927E